MPVVFGIVELDMPQVLRVILAGRTRGQRNSLIATQSRGLVHGARVDATTEQVGLATNNEERLCLMQGEPASEIGEAPIHDVEAAGFWNQDVEHIYLVHLAVADVNEGWNIAAQVEQRMHLDGGFGLTKVSPREDAQAQVDSRGIECVDRLFQLHSKAVLRIEFACQFDLTEREILIDATKLGNPLSSKLDVELTPPIARFVGVGQCALGDVSTDAHFAW